MLIEKNGTKKRLRRSKFQGVFVQLSLSEHLTSVEARINAVQVNYNIADIVIGVCMYTCE